MVVGIRQVGGEMRLARSIEQINTEFFEALDKVRTFTPYTLHLTPDTLHPTPYTYTLHLTPYTLHPTPFTLHPTPNPEPSTQTLNPKP